MIKKERFSSLKSKILLSTLIPVVASFSLIIVVILIAISNISSDRVREKFQLTSQKYAHNFERRIYDALNYLSILASEMETYIEAGRADRKILHDTVQNIFDGYGFIDGSGVFFEPGAYDNADAAYIATKYGSAKSGRICWYFYRDSGTTAYLPETLGNEREFDLPHYTETKKHNKAFYTDPAVYEINGKIFSRFTLAWPIRNSKGEFIGAVTADIFLDQVYAQLRNEIIYDSGYVGIYNDRNRIVYCPVYEFIGKNREEAGLDAIPPQFINIPGFFNSVSMTNGKNSLVAINPVYIFQLDSRFYISVTVPLDEIYADDRRTFFFLLAFSTGVIAAIALFVSFLIRKVSAPLDEITAGVNRIAGGDYKARIEGKYKGEFAVVKTSVNKMADSIEAHINESEKSLSILKNILNGLETLIYVTVPETGEVLFINDNMRRHYGIKDDSIGFICYKVLQSGMNDRCPFCPRFKLDKNPEKTIVWEMRSTVTNRIYRNTDRYIDWPGGKIAHLQHGVDITELIAARELAEQGSRSKSEFLSRMSHEMRTPMTAILGMTGIAKNSKDPEKKEYCLDRINDASHHLLGVINDILDMSKIEADKFELSISEFGFAQMLASVVNVVRFRIDEKKQTLSIFIDPAMPKILSGDEQHLAQIVTNLLTNAAKFTPEGGRIQCRAQTLSEDRGIVTVQVEVIDNGIGISKEQQGKLFRSFEQADGSIARKFGGTGLGLAISKRIVEMMDGTIQVESDIGKGSKFTFTFKAGRGTGQFQTSGIPELSAAGTPEPKISSGLFKGKAALLAEDMEINREIVLAMLEDTGLQISCVENGNQAVEAFKARPSAYNIILMDLQMPEVDGLEATRRIRALPAGQTIPIVAMTANAFREDIDACLEAGMNDHIGKPINPEELLRRIEKNIS